MPGRHRAPSPPQIGHGDGVRGTAEGRLGRLPRRRAGLALASRGRVPAVDARLHDAVAGYRGRRSVRAALTLTNGGSKAAVWPMVAVAGLIVDGSPGRRWPDIAMVTAGVGLAIGVRLAASNVVRRPRPPEAGWAGYASGGAFPSGHTTAATIGAGTLAWAVTRRLADRRARAAVSSLDALHSGAVGWSRIWFGVHWPLDVIGAWLYGIGALTALGAFHETIRRRCPTEGSCIIGDAGSPGRRRMTKVSRMVLVSASVAK